MAHREQQEYCLSVKTRHPAFFINKTVLDVGSYDVNGNNRFLFENCVYTGIDVGPGPNVDIVTKGHEYNADDESFDTIISTECFEHDMYYEQTLRNILRMLKKGGLFLFTCATIGRGEHGTLRTTKGDAPPLNELGDWANYYKNLTEHDVLQAIDVSNSFSKHEFKVGTATRDLYFYGIKRND